MLDPWKKWGYPSDMTRTLRRYSKETMQFFSIFVLFIAAFAVGAQQGHDMTQGMHDRHSKKAHGTPGMETETCDLGIRFTEAAERRPGGALYAKATAHAQMGGVQDQQMAMTPGSEGMQDHAAHAGAMATVPKMHERHNPQHGGEQFFMAPDKLHHLEPVYSERCGLRVVFYNAHSEAIRPDSFRAFARVIPSSKMEPERMRFLELSADGSVLQAELGSDLTPPFEAELYVRFPESDDPELFNVFITK